MDTRKALETLKRPQFGNDEQIRAIHYLEDVEAARVAFGKCRHGKCGQCKGEGTVGGRIDAAPCDYCDGSGRAGCHHFNGLIIDAILEAKRR
jgi:uncharacterized CHY-type Zn-finger protein